MKNQNTNPEKIKWVIKQVEEHGGIDYTQKKMYQYRDEALAILNDFPESKVRSALEDLVRYTTDRKY